MGVDLLQNLNAKNLEAAHKLTDKAAGVTRNTQIIPSWFTSSTPLETPGATNYLHPTDFLRKYSENM